MHFRCGHQLGSCAHGRNATNIGYGNRGTSGGVRVEMTHHRFVVVIVLLLLIIITINLVLDFVILYNFNLFLFIMNIFLLKLLSSYFHLCCPSFIMFIIIIHVWTSSPYAITYSSLSSPSPMTGYNCLTAYSIVGGH